MSLRGRKAPEALAHFMKKIASPITLAMTPINEFDLLATLLK
jgi:hypothetical protein